MDRLKEIEARRLEIKDLLEGDEKVNIEELRKELDELDQEETSLKVDEEERKEKLEREKRAEIAEKLEERKLKGKELEENKNMEERYTIKSPEYRSAWAKKMMNLPEDKFTKEELRALGDAVTTSATTYVAAAAGTQGINNGGLFHYFF